jgi:putative ABC transport system permease protein
VSGIVGTLVEAWDELRIHKLRVLLALIGVAVAVTAITGITAAVQMMNQAFNESIDRQNGRPVTLTMFAYPTAGPVAGAPAEEEYSAAYATLLDRYDITYASRQNGNQLPFRFPTGTSNVVVQAVDPD